MKENIIIDETQPNIIENKNEHINSNINQLKQLVNMTGYIPIEINRLDYYANSIPIGAFCNAVAFILYGFKLCHVFNYEGPFLNGVLIIFGGIGQITSGVLEFMKGRHFPSLVYFTFGLYCASLYYILTNPNLQSSFSDLSTFYGAWMIISIPITISSIKINLLYVLHTFLTMVFFVLEVFGEGFKEDKVINNAGGIILSISGFVSLYIFINQIINEAVKFQILPAIPFVPDNEIDIVQDYKGNLDK